MGLLFVLPLLLLSMYICSRATIVVIILFFVVVVVVVVVAVVVGGGVGVGDNCYFLVCNCG